MRVLHILNELRHSGAEVMLAVAGRYFLSAGIEGHVLGTREHIGDFAPELKAAGYRVYHIPYDRSRRRPLGSNYDALVRLLIEKRFDAVHIHSERRSSFEVRLLSRMKVPVVVRTVHHIFPQSMTPKGQLKRLLTSYHRWVGRNLYGVIFVSNSPSGWQNEYKTYFSRNLLVPNWFDSQSFTPASRVRKKEVRERLGLDPTTFVLVTLGGNRGYKNYDLIVRALALIPDEEKILYLQVGPQGESNPLERLAAELGVSHRLRCAGKVQEPLDYLHAADGYAMPSKIEGFGCAAAEAMGAGLPVLLADVPALSDFRDFCSDIVYIHPDVASVVSGIRALMKMGQTKREQIGLELSRAAHSHYAVEVGAGMYAEIYRGKVPSYDF